MKVDITYMTLESYTDAVRGLRDGTISMSGTIAYDPSMDPSPSYRPYQETPVDQTRLYGHPEAKKP